MRAMLKAQINKTDRNDARGIAQMMRVGLYRPVHVKTLRSQKLRVLLTHRKLLQSQPPCPVSAYCLRGQPRRARPTLQEGGLHARRFRWPMTTEAGMSVTKQSRGRRTGRVFRRSGQR
jgi:hypothetical protein